jgi:hypothetical protein
MGVARKVCLAGTALAVPELAWALTDKEKLEALSAFAQTDRGMLLLMGTSVLIGAWSVNVAARLLRIDASFSASLIATVVVVALSAIMRLFVPDGASWMLHLFVGLALMTGGIKLCLDASIKQAFACGVLSSFFCAVIGVVLIFLVVVPLVMG